MSTQEAWRRHLTWLAPCGSKSTSTISHILKNSTLLKSSACSRIAHWVLAQCHESLQTKSKGVDVGPAGSAPLKVGYSLRIPELPWGATSGCNGHGSTILCVQL